MNKYAALFLQMRLIADQAGDDRSLVALAAQFERDADSVVQGLRQSLWHKSHIRNAPQL